MTSRQHARSKKRKAPPTPRTFTAATGLTGVTPEEAARRAAITAAALAAAERSEAKASKRASFVRSMRPTGPPELSTSPDRVRGPETDEPQEEAAPNPSRPGAEQRPEPSAVVASEDRPEGRSTARSEPKAPTNSPRLFKLHAQGVSSDDQGVSSGDQGVSSEAAAESARKPVVRPGRVFKLPDPDTRSDSATDRAAGTTGLADGVSIAEALKAPGRSKDHSERAITPDGTVAMTSRWQRVRSSVPRDRSHRRPAGGDRPDSGSSSPTGPGSSSPTGPGSSRRTISLVGRKTRATKKPTTESADNKTTKKSGTNTPRSGQAPANKKKAETKRARKKQARKKAPSTPLERRRRIPVALAAVFALVVLATNFPLTTILGQHSQQSAASSQLAKVQDQNKALTQQQEALQSNVAINELARGDYQMVTPGQTLYDVLPSGQKAGTTPGAPTSGDPGSQPLVAPNNAPDLSPQQALPTPIPATAADSPGSATSKGVTAGDVTNDTAPPTPSSYWGRVTDTLEFWR